MLGDIYRDQQKVLWFPQPLFLDGHGRVVQNAGGAGGLPGVKIDITKSINIGPVIGLDLKIGESKCIDLQSKKEFEKNHNFIIGDKKKRNVGLKYLKIDFNLAEIGLGVSLGGALAGPLWGAVMDRTN